jgi:hypothetical protein
VAYFDGLQGDRVTIGAALLVLVPLLSAAVHHSIAHHLRRRRCSGRLGRLPGAATPTAEAARAVRLRELGEAGTYLVLNCGRILHVDYDRGVLIVEREGRDFRR